MPTDAVYARITLNAREYTRAMNALARQFVELDAASRKLAEALYVSLPRNRRIAYRISVYVRRRWVDFHLRLTMRA